MASNTMMHLLFFLLASSAPLAANSITLDILQPDTSEVAAASPSSNDLQFPSSISLRAGVIAAPPFATVTINQQTGELEYGGFQIDLLRQMQIFAQEDNVTLNLEFSPAPPQYGPAFHLVASDCADLAARPEAPHSLEDCDKFDMIVADYYATAERHLRAALSVPWLRSAISAVKYLDKTGPDYTTLSQAEQARAPVCLKDGTFYAGEVRRKYPNAVYFLCDNQEACVQSLKQEDCVLYPDDELQLLYAAAWDPTLLVTGESFLTQYLVWAYSRQLPQVEVLLMDKWMRDAITNSTVDELYYQYFQKALCPLGTAGEQCELPCDPDHGKSNVKGECICESAKWTGADCSLEIPENTNALSPGMVVAGYVLFGVNVLAALICAGWLYWKRSSPQVLVSQPFFLSLVLVGCLISSSTILALAQKDDGEGPVPACMAIPWLYSIGFCVTFGTLFAKIRRMYILFKSSLRTSNIGSISFSETLCVIGTILFVDIVVLVSWSVLDPLEWTREVTAADQFGASLESVGYCTADHWMVWTGLIAALHLLLMGIACYMCYVTRNIPTRFAEGKYLSIAMISNLQIMVVGVPILIIIGADPQTGFFVRTVIVWMNDLVILCLIFGNLTWSVHGPKENNDRAPETVKSVVGDAIELYKQRSVVSRHASSGLLEGTAEDSVQSGQQRSLDQVKESGEDEFDEEGCGAVGELKSHKKLADVLPGATSWGLNTLSIIHNQNENEHSDDEDENEEISPLSQHFEKPVDILKDDRCSWGMIATSTVESNHNEGTDV